MQSLNELLKIAERPVQGPSPAFERAHLLLAFLTIGESGVPFYTRGSDDVAGIPGRIVKVAGRVRASSPPAFGASSHLARAVLKVEEYDERIRALANIKYSERILKVARGLGYAVTFYDRKNEPASIKRKEGTTRPWVVEGAIKKAGRVPDMIYDKGDIGKEPMMRIFGTDAADVASKVVKTARDLKKG